MNLKAEFKFKTWFTSFMLNETESAPIANVRREFYFTYVSPPVTPMAEWFFFCCFPPLSDEGSPRGYLSARRHKTTHTQKKKNYDRIARFLKVKRWSSPADVIGNLQNKSGDFHLRFQRGVMNERVTCAWHLPVAFFFGSALNIQGISDVWERTLRRRLHASSWSWRQNTPPCWLN